jgi:hypothetical protein
MGRVLSDDSYVLERRMTVIGQLIYHCECEHFYIGLGHPEQPA